MTTRIFLGFFEGCLFPSMTLFLCNWPVMNTLLVYFYHHNAYTTSTRYTRGELGIRVAYLFIASALSGAFGGLIALGVLYMDGVNGWPGWRWWVHKNIVFGKKCLVLSDQLLGCTSSRAS